VLRFNGAQMPVDQPNGDFPYPHVAQCREDVSIKTSSVCGDRRGGAILALEVGEPCFGNGGELRGTCDLRVGVYTCSIAKCTSESITRGAFRVTMALDLTDMAIEIPHSGHGTEARVGLVDADRASGAEAHRRAAHTHKNPITYDAHQGQTKDTDDKLGALSALFMALIDA
jgi:hypothetical protein